MLLRLIKFVIISTVILGCSSTSRLKNTSISKMEKTSTINVALYPYLKYVSKKYEENSKEILKKLWKIKHPNITLNFIEYNSYKKAPPSNIDVFVMDALFISSFAQKGWILPIEKSSIQNIDDVLPHTLEGCLYNNSYYGIPQFGCANILYYRSNDLEIKNCESINSLYQIIGKANYQNEMPPQNKSLLVDLSSGTTNLCWYLEAVMDKSGIYSETPELSSPNKLDKESINNVKKMVEMGGKKQSTSWTEKRPKWFSNGYGRCYIGFTENMFQMEQSKLKDISMRLVPSYKNSDVDLFFMDAAVISSSVKSLEKKKLSIELANLISSTEHMVKSCENGNSAFYYMPCRKSIFENLGKQYPKYHEMYRLIKNSNPKTFRLGINGFDKLNSNYKDLVEKIILE